MKISPKVTILYASTFILAACSIMYELILAQSMSAVLGNTILRYNITIGLYCASLGAGSYIQSLIRRDEKELLVIVEFFLTLLGGLSPVLIILTEKLFQYLSFQVLHQPHSTIPDSAYSIVAHSLIVLVGILSGIELPLLMKIGGKIEARLSNRMLTADYIGSFAGALIFPLLLLPVMGLFSSALLTGFANSLVALYFIRQQKGAGAFFRFSLPLLCLAFVIMIVFQSDIHFFFIDNLYLG